MSTAVYAAIGGAAAGYLLVSVAAAAFIAGYLAGHYAALACAREYKRDAAAEVATARAKAYSDYLASLKEAGDKKRALDASPNPIQTAQQERMSYEESVKNLGLSAEQAAEILADHAGRTRPGR